jgi:hypothetical protein
MAQIIKPEEIQISQTRILYQDDEHDDDLDDE